MKPQVRWLIRRDVREVMEIIGVFGVPLCEDELIGLLRQRNHIGMVVEDNGEIVAFMVYALHPTALDCKFIAGRDDAVAQMMERLVDKMSQQRRNRVYFRVGVERFNCLKSVQKGLDNIRHEFKNAEKYTVENGDHYEFGFYTIRTVKFNSVLDDGDLLD